MRTEDLTQKQTHDMEAGIVNQRQATRWSREEILVVRQQRLRHLLKYAKQHSKWYAKQLAHIDADNFTEAQLKDCPTLNKETLI